MAEGMLSSIIDKRNARVESDNKLYNEGKQGIAMNTLSGIANAAGMFGDLGGEVLSSAYSLLPKENRDRASSHLKGIAETDIMKSVGNTLKEFAQENPNGAKTAMNILDLSSVVGVTGALKGVLGKEFWSNFTRNMTNERKAFYSGNPSAMVAEALSAVGGGIKSFTKQSFSAQARANARQGITLKTQTISQNNLDAMAKARAHKMRIVNADIQKKNSKARTPERETANVELDSAKKAMTQFKTTDEWKSYRKAGQLAQGQIAQDFLLGRQFDQFMPLIEKLSGTTWISGGTLSKKSFGKMLDKVDTLNTTETDALFRMVQQIHAPKGIMGKLINKTLNFSGKQKFVEKPKMASSSSGDLAKDALRSETEILRFTGQPKRTIAAETINAGVNSINKGAKWVAGKFNKKFESDLELPFKELRSKVPVYAGIKEVFQNQPSLSTFQTSNQFAYSLKQGLNSNQLDAIKNRMEGKVGSIDSQLNKAFETNPLLAQAKTAVEFMKQIKASGVSVEGLTLKRATHAFKKKNTEPFSNKVELMDSLEAQGLTVYNKAKVLEDPNQPVLLQGNHKSTAYELGSVNIIHKVDLDGTITNIVNDGNDLLGVPAPRGGEMYTFSTFTTTVAGKPNMTKATKAKKAALNRQNMIENNRRGQQIADELGVDITDRPPNSMSPSEYAVLKGVAGFKAPVKIQDRVGAGAMKMLPPLALADALTPVGSPNRKE
tara:strand:- start:48 stop:2204 length:2157 start_codon:yes stop_codon:yes gene_type:complete